MVLTKLQKKKRKYTKYKKKLEKNIFAAKTTYYSGKIDTCKNESKTLWKIINEITSRKPVEKKLLHKLCVENKNVIEDPKSIANALD